MDMLKFPLSARKLLATKHKLKFYIDPDFPPAAQENILNGIELATEILTSERIGHWPHYDCAVAKVKKPLNQQFPLHMLGLWHDLFFGHPNGFPVKAKLRGRRKGYFETRIVQLWDEPKPDDLKPGDTVYLGRAVVGHFYNGPSVIAMNRQWTNGELFDDYPSAGDCADTMVHEMLHTFGFDHPEDSDAGTFVGEYGKCFHPDSGLTLIGKKFHLKK